MQRLSASRSGGGALQASKRSNVSRFLMRPRYLSQLEHPKNEVPIETELAGQALLNFPALNKGSAFSREERKAFDLEGLLPYEVHTLDQQCERALWQLRSRKSDVLKYSFLRSLADQNKVLYFNFIARNLKECIPIIYTPTAGDAAIEYSHLFQRPDQGVFLSYPNRATLARQLAQHGDDSTIDLIVVCDGQAILGIGDWGCGGMTISAAKASIYTLGGGINPSRILPVVLDVGTDRESLLNDDLYLGWKHSRLQGPQYNEFVGQFCDEVKKQFPSSLLHFEDFGTANAQRLLDEYRPKQSVFNDDIQGTAAVSLAALLSACRVTGTKLEDQRIVTFGFGSAGLGITTELLRHIQLYCDIPASTAAKKFYALDRFGLLVKSSDQLRPGQEVFAAEDEEVKDWERDEEGCIRLAEVVKRVKPTILIGCSGQPKAFTEDILRTMAENCEHPIIMPLSNPTKLCECDPHDANDWTGGKAIFATGSPFPPVENPDGTKKEVAQANNALIYPGLALGTIVSRATRLSDKMIHAGVDALASLSPALSDPNKAVLPNLYEMRQVSRKVAVAVANAAREEGLMGEKAREEREARGVENDAEFTEEEVRERAYDPVYRPLKRCGSGGQTFVK